MFTEPIPLVSQELESPKKGKDDPAASVPLTKANLAKQFPSQNNDETTPKNEIDPNQEMLKNFPKLVDVSCEAQDELYQYMEDLQA